MVITAGSEIRLQVGRTTLVIDDGSFTVTTRNVTGNFVNTFDTAFQMTPRDGIVITGKTVNITALYRFVMFDGWGGTLMSTMGNLVMSGREIGLDSKNQAEFKALGAVQTLYHLVNTVSAGCALNGKVDDASFTGYLKLILGLIKTVTSKGLKIMKKWQANHPSTNEGAGGPPATT